MSSRRNSTTRNQICECRAKPIPPSSCAVVDALDDPVTLAASCSEAFSIKDGDPAVLVFDQPLGLQPAGGFGDAGSAHPQHIRQKSMRETELVRPHAVA